MIKISVGAGKRDFGPEWIHVDGEKYPHVISSDIWLMEHNKNTVDEIYCSHFLEYFDREYALKLLKEWHSVLKPGGIIRIAVPDFAMLSYAYTDLAYSLSDIIGPLFGEMKMGDRLIHHKTVYDYDSLNNQLVNAGFKDVVCYDWRDTEHAHIDDHSRAHLPHDTDAIATGNFTKDHLLISLNVEATKP